MATTEQYLNQLIQDKNNLKTNLQEKGVEVTDTDTFTQLSTKVSNIQTGVEIIPPTIDSVEKNVGSTEITLKVTSTQGYIAEHPNLTIPFSYQYSKDGGLTFVSSQEPTYIFTGLEKNTLYHIEIRAVDEVGQYSSYTEDITALDSIPFAQWIKNNVPLVTSGVGLYHHTADLTNGAEDNNYRYAGKTPNNWVKFNNENYRIIGVYGNNVKLIKNESIGTKSWDDTNSNNWERPATLNTYFNGEWYNSLGNDKNLIADYNWQIGGMSWSNFTNKTVPEVYNLELGNNKTEGLSSPTKIGLMYVSDYLYAAPQGKWTLCGYNESSSSQDYRSAYTEDWMYSSDYPWTISRISDYSFYVFRVNSGGTVNYDLASFSIAVRPVFYLESNVTFSRGEGSSSDPYNLGYDKLVLGPCGLGEPL